MKLNKIFKTIEFIKNSENILLDCKEYKAMRGKHSIWIPDLQMKFPFQYNGVVIEYKDVKLGQHWSKIINGTWGTEKNSRRNSFFNIIEEYVMFDLLFKKRYSPNVCNFFFIKQITSEFPWGKKNIDSKGILGFFMVDANNYPHKTFSKEQFEIDFIKTGILKVSASALTDITMATRNNLVNNYIVDLRRSYQDAVHLGNEKDLKTVLNVYNDLFVELGM